MEFHCLLFLISFQIIYFYIYIKGKNMNVGDNLTSRVSLHQKWYLSKQPNETISSIKNALYVGDSMNRISSIQIGNDAFTNDDLVYVYVLATSTLSGYAEQNKLLRSTEKISKSKIWLGDIVLDGEPIVGGNVNVSFMVMTDSVFFDSNTSIIK